ncbi:MAG: LacI family DNA-binding transcriptional regulator [Collinsella sp.]|nr:LacI family DNA-binding transcriptional regulator [Collinsella sp.]
MAWTFLVRALLTTIARFHRFQIPYSPRGRRYATLASMKDRRATISDIAMAAGVSKTTVSRFINGQSDLISPATRKRIEWAIAQAHYRPSSTARSLKTRASGCIGVVVDVASEGIVEPFVRGMQEEIASLDDPSRRETVPLVTFSRGEDDAARLTALFEDMRAACVLFVSARDAEPPHTLCTQDGPIVVCSPNPQADVVMRAGGDLARCGREAIRALFDSAAPTP